MNAWNVNPVPLNISSDPATLNTIFTNYQSYRPYPNFGNINLWSNFGHSTYHSGTVKLEKRFSSGLTLTSFSTLSRRQSMNPMLTAKPVAQTSITGDWKKLAPGSMWRIALSLI